MRRAMKMSLSEVLSEIPPSVTELIQGSQYSKILQQSFGVGWHVIFWSEDSWKSGFIIERQIIEKIEMADLATRSFGSPPPSPTHDLKYIVHRWDDRSKSVYSELDSDSLILPLTSGNEKQETQWMADSKVCQFIVGVIQHQTSNQK